VPHETVPQRNLSSVNEPSHICRRGVKIVERLWCATSFKFLLVIVGSDSNQPGVCICMTNNFFWTGWFLAYIFIWLAG